MESLLCDEVLLMSPKDSLDDMHATDHKLSPLLYQTEVDFKQAFGILLEKEMSYMPQPGYGKHVKSNSLINKARFKAICWLIKSGRLMNLSFGTVFNAANYLDRFISINQCQGWKYWMFELLSVACLSVASKFNETSSPPLCEFQMEGLEHSFESSLIQRMELTLLKVLGWRLGSITPYSYVELLTWSIRYLNKTLSEELIERVTKLLLSALLDSKFLEFRPCVIAVSAMTYVFGELLPSTENAYLAHLNSCIPEDRKDELTKCQEIMNKQLMDDYRLSNSCNSYDHPSSPVTVLTVEQLDSCCCQLDLILMKNPPVNLNFKPSKRRKREKQKYVV